MTVRFQFGPYVVDPLTRTVHRESETQTPEPKVFDALLLLLTQRNRVVTKNEILAHVWGERVVVTEGVIARTIMKARRLIGDDADDPTVIKTVHRVGYRFVAPVDELPMSANAEALQRNPAVPEAQNRLAILPIHNLTGTPSFAWMDLGLMSTTIDALHAVPGTAIVPAADLLAVMGVGAWPLDIEGAAAKLAQAVGASDVLQGEISVDHDGEFALSYRGTGPRLNQYSGSRTGRDAVEMCRAWAADIARHVSGVAGADPLQASPNDAAKDSHFVDMARSRALHAIHLERWELARALLRVALNMAPTDLALRVDHARCLVWQRDRTAIEILEQAIERAREIGDATTEMRALQLYGVFLHDEGKLDEAERMLSAALKIAESNQDQDTELNLLVSIGETLAGEERPAVAAWMLDRAGHLAISLGNQLAMARLLDVRGRLAIARGDAVAAQAAFRESADLSERHGICATAAFSLAHLGYTMVNEGRMIAAAECFARAFRHACQSGSTISMGLTGLYLARFGVPVLQSSNCAVVLEQLRRAGGGNRDLAHGCADLVHALILAREGRIEDSLALCESAVQRVGGSRALTLHAKTARLLALVCAGHHEEAAVLCDQLQELATGKFRSRVQGRMLHYRALIARARHDNELASSLLLECVGASPPSLMQAHASMDAAWIQLEMNEPARATSTLSHVSAFMSEALACEYGAAMLVQARVSHATGDAARATALQQRYCEIMRCATDSPAAQWADVYRRASAGSHGPGTVLPSLFDLMPSLA